MPIFQLWSLFNIILLYDYYRDQNLLKYLFIANKRRAFAIVRLGNSVEKNHWHFECLNQRASVCVCVQVCKHTSGLYSANSNVRLQPNGRKKRTVKLTNKEISEANSIKMEIEMEIKRW